MTTLSEADRKALGLHTDGCGHCENIEAFVTDRVAATRAEVVAQVEAIVRARGDGDFTPLLPKLRALTETTEETT